MLPSFNTIGQNPTPRVDVVGVTSCMSTAFLTLPGGIVSSINVPLRRSIISPCFVACSRPSLIHTRNKYALGDLGL